MPRVLVTRRLPDGGLAPLLTAGHEVVQREGDEPYSPAELVAAVADVDAVVCILTDRIDAAVLQAGTPRLQVVGNVAVGYDNVDVATASELGIAVCNTPGVLDETTADLAELLAQSDIVSLHVPGGDATRHLIDARRLALIKPSAVLVNTARGTVVDEAALADALHDGRLFAAGIDVYEREPEIHPRLLSARRTVLLPHIGSASQSTRLRMATMATEAVATVLAGGTPPNVVT
jgi:lactate dehydrogenase-like 2-hydroxyacid dehydrogenase